MAKHAHDRKSVEKITRAVRLAAGELMASLKLFDGQVEEMEDGERMEPYNGSVYVQGEAEMRRAVQALKQWSKHLRGELLNALADPEQYQKDMKAEMAEDEKKRGGEPPTQRKNGRAKK